MQSVSAKQEFTLYKQFFFSHREDVTVFRPESSPSPLSVQTHSSRRALALGYCASRQQGLPPRGQDTRSPCRIRQDPSKNAGTASPVGPAPQGDAHQGRPRAPQPRTLAHSQVRPRQQQVSAPASTGPTARASHQVPAPGHHSKHTVSPCPPALSGQPRHSKTLP